MCEDWVPSTNLLWGDLDSSVTHEIVPNLEQDKMDVGAPTKESFTLDDIQASTSSHPKPS